MWKGAQIYCSGFFPALLRYNWQLKFYIFKVHNTIIWYTYISQRTWYWWLSNKESAWNAGATGKVGSIPRSKRSPGGENGNPLQYSYLENLMDRGPWWATVNEIAKSQEQLKQLSMRAYIMKWFQYQVNWHIFHLI